MNRLHYCLGFCFSSDKSHVALVHKLKPSWQLGKLNGIGGKIEHDESGIDAMVREFKEETGVLILPWRHLCKLEGDWGAVFMWKYFGDEVFNVKTVESERIEIFKVDDIPWNKTIPNLRWIIPLALDKDNVHGEIYEENFSV